MHITWIPILASILSFILIIPYFSLFKINVSNFGKYNWKDIVLAEMIPKPQSQYGEIISNTDDTLTLNVTKVTEEEFLLTLFKD